MNPKSSRLLVESAVLVAACATVVMYSTSWKAKQRSKRLKSNDAIKSKSLKSEYPIKSFSLLKSFRKMARSLNGTEVAPKALLSTITVERDGAIEQQEPNRQDAAWSLEIDVSTTRTRSCCFNETHDSDTSNNDDGDDQYDEQTMIENVQKCVLTAQRETDRLRNAQLKTKKQMEVEINQWKMRVWDAAREVHSLRSYCLRCRH